MNADEPIFSRLEQGILETKSSMRVTLNWLLVAKSIKIFGNDRINLFRVSATLIRCGFGNYRHFNLPFPESCSTFTAVGYQISSIPGSLGAGVRQGENGRHGCVITICAKYQIN